MGLSKPIIIQDSSVDISNLATKSDIDSIKNSVGSVKSVQRGATSVGDAQYKDVTISSVDSTKTFINILGSVTNDKIKAYEEYPAAYLESNTKLRIINSATKSTISWEVIEFK